MLLVHVVDDEPDVSAVSTSIPAPAAQEGQ